MSEPVKRVVNTVEGDITGNVAQLGDGDVTDVVNTVRGTVSGVVLQIGSVRGDVD